MIPAVIQGESGATWTGWQIVALYVLHVFNKIKKTNPHRSLLLMDNYETVKKSQMNFILRD